MNVRAIAAVLAASLAMAGTMPAHAGSMGVALDSAIYVERMNGLTRSLRQADRLSRGDRIVTILTWQKQGGLKNDNAGFTVVNPLPRTVAYQGSARDDEQVSVDGGKTWGRLGELTAGSRLATAEDVTHVRWHVDPRQAAIGQGRIAYSGIVR
ncbi:MAG: hypothetical protein ABIQ81_07775 [Novosphingobium sp.]